MSAPAKGAALNRPNPVQDQPSGEISELSASSLRGKFNPNPSLDRTIREVMGDALERIEAGTSSTCRTASDIAKVCMKWISDNLTRRDRQVAARTSVEAKDVGADSVAVFVPGVTPVAIGLSLLAIRNAAYLAHTNPEKLPEARAKLLMGLADVSAFVTASTWWISPAGAVAGSLLLAAKLCNSLYKILRKSQGDEKSDQLMKAAESIAERFIMKQCLNGLLKSIYALDSSIITRVDSLKNEFAPSASQREKELGLKKLAEFHAMYAKYYPKGQQESREAMSSYLADQVDKWDLHILEKDSKVVGGFTCFTQEHETFGKHLVVEQVLPPAEIDPVGNQTTWAYIRSLAKEIGAQRIWLETRASEPLPDGFQGIKILHAQPALKGKNTGSVGLPGCNPKDELCMSVCTLDRTTDIPSHLEYHAVVLACTESWADKGDPAWELLLKNRKDTSPLNLKAPPAESAPAQAPSTVNLNNPETEPPLLTTTSTDRTQLSLVP